MPLYPFNLSFSLTLSVSLSLHVFLFRHFSFCASLNLVVFLCPTSLAICHNLDFFHSLHIHTRTHTRTLAHTHSHTHALIRMYSQSQRLSTHLIKNDKYASRAEPREQSGRASTLNVREGARAASFFGSINKKCILQLKKGSLFCFSNINFLTTWTVNQVAGFN